MMNELHLGYYVRIEVYTRTVSSEHTDFLPTLWGVSGKLLRIKGSYNIFRIPCICYSASICVICLYLCILFISCLRLSICAFVCFACVCVCETLHIQCMHIFMHEPKFLTYDYLIISFVVTNSLWVCVIYHNFRQKSYLCFKCWSDKAFCVF